MAHLRYVLSLKGAASPTVRSAFADCDLETAGSTTLVYCAQGDLGVVTARIQDLGLELLEVHLVSDPGVPDPRRPI